MTLIRSKSKVLLIQPPIRDMYRTGFREYPLGLLYLATALIRAGCGVALLDARKCRRPIAVKPYPEISHIEEIYRGRNLFNKFYHFGMKYDEIAKAAAEIKPDIVCISSMFTPYETEVIETARTIKATFPRCRIIVGGCHASADPESLIKHPFIDTVVCGEGEDILPDIIANGTVGIVRCKTALLSEEFRPARNLINPLDYVYRKKPYTMILTSRGCPHRCSFCSIHTVMGHNFRPRTAEAVTEEIGDCIKRYGMRTIDFQDDNLLFVRKRAIELLTTIEQKRWPDIEFMATNGLNAAHIDGEILKLMKRCGFKKLDIAIGTGDVKSRTDMQRPETIGKYEEALESAIELGFDVTTYIIIGIPTQPLAEMHETIGCLMKKKTLIAPSIFYNVPGMPVFEAMKKYEYAASNVARRGTAVNCFGEDFDRTDILDIFEKIRTYNLSYKKRPLFPICKLSYCKRRKKYIYNIRH